MEELKSLTQLAGSLTVTAVLLYGLWALVNGKVITKGHHDEVVEATKADAQRGWETAEKTAEALAANNAVVERFVDAVQAMQRTVESMQRTVEELSRRRE